MNAKTPTRRVVIIGGVAGGASAAARLRRMDEFAQITLVERGPDVSFANCGLPYHIGGEIADRERLAIQTPASLRILLGIDVRALTEATHIDRESRTVTVVDRTSGQVSQLPYDRLILAPGAAPLRPPLRPLLRPPARPAPRASTSTAPSRRARRRTGRCAVRTAPRAG